MTDIEGIWDIIRALDSGEEVIEEKAFLRISGQDFERVTSKHTFTRTIRLESSKTPSSIDLFITNEPNKGKTFLGIYKLEGETLFIAHARPGRERPMVFESTRENGFILSVSKKRKASSL